MKKILNALIIYVSVALILVIILALIFQNDSLMFWKKNNTKIDFLQINEKWADSVLSTMSIDEKIAQMILYKVDTDSLLQDSLNYYLQKKISGIVFDSIKFENKLLYSSYFQANSKNSAFIFDMLNVDFPSNLTIATAGEEELLKKYFNENSQDIINYGFNISSINFETSKYLNISNQILFNPESRSEVAEKIVENYKSLNDNKIITCVKYFSFYYNFENLDSDFKDSLLFPYQNICKSGASAIFLDKNILKDSLSKTLNLNDIKNYLEKELKFHGLIISEKINLKDSKNSIENTIKSGVDLLIINDSLQFALDKIREMVEDNQLPENELNTRVKKILLAKNWTTKTINDTLKINKIIAKIKKSDKTLNLLQIYQNSIVLLKNTNFRIPFVELKNNNFVEITIGNDNLPVFIENMQFYTEINEKYYKNLNDFTITDLNSYQNIIIAINDLKINNLKDSLFLKNLNILNKNKNIVLINFCEPENLKYFENIKTIVQVFDNNKYIQSLSGQFLFGALYSDAKLPLTFSKIFEQGTGADYKKIQRLKYTIPEDANMSSEKLCLIDSIVNEAIAQGAFPGCEIFVAKDGKVVYYNDFGYQTYEKERKVIRTDLYDLASVTKVAATTLLGMRLYEKGLIKLEDSIKYYLNDTINLTFKNHQIRDFLLHKTGLPSFMPVAKYIVYRKKGTDRYGLFFSEKSDSIHTLKVAEDFYFNKNYLDSIWYDIFTSRYDTLKNYIYSDMNFNVLYKIFTSKINISFEEYLSQNFYQSLGLQTLCFRPLERFDKYRIAPTQDDKYWRKQLLRGYVHDESAALNNCAWGNAGLFSNANDLGIIFQMLLNGGVYGGIQYFDKSTVDLFTTPPEDSDRGLGFAMSDFNSFGHYGFTGTCVWASKKYNIVYVFLSNRVNPIMTNTKIQELKTREQIFETIIKSIN